MKAKFILPVAVLVSVMAGSCTDDSSEYGGIDLPELSVNVPDKDKMPVYNFNYGEDCVLTPDIDYTGGGTLTYEWSVGTLSDGVKGPLEVVSHEKVLTYFFPQGGSYYAHLVATDGTVGVVQDYEININRTFEQGYLILSNNREGKGNLAFIKDPTREDIEAGLPVVVMENCLQRVNPEVGDAMLSSAMMLQWSAWTGSGSKPMNRLVIATEDAGYYVDPNTFVISSQITFDEIIPGFKGRQMICDYTSPIVFDPVMKKYITLNSEYMFGYEDSSWSGHYYDKVHGEVFKVGQNLTTINFFINCNPLSLSGHTYYGWLDDSKLTYDGKPLFQGHELITVFMGEAMKYYFEMYDMWLDYYPCYVLTREGSTGKYYFTRLRGFGSYDAEIALEGRGEISGSDMAVPEADASIAVSSKYHRNYYSVGSRVYTMLIDGDKASWPDKSQYSIEFPNNEEVTYMTVDSSTDRLIVATADKSTGRGSIYIYEVKDVRTDNPGVSPSAHYPDCADRISKVFYKPRVNN